MNEHPARAQLISLADPPILLVVLREGLLELLGDASAHHTYAVDGVDEGFDVSLEQVASRVLDHEVASIVKPRVSYGQGWLAACRRYSIAPRGPSRMQA